MSSAVGRPTGVRGLYLRPLSVRVRKIVAGPRDALETRYDLYAPLELFFSGWRDDYLAGRIKVVSNSIPLQHSSIHYSFSIVPVPGADWQMYAVRHRQRLIDELETEYLNAVRRFSAEARGLHSKAAQRMRYRSNKSMKAAGRRDPDFVDELFAETPEALAKARQIRAIWENLRYGSMTGA